MFLAELQNQGLAGISAELASAALKIAGQLGEELSAVLIGGSIGDNAQDWREIVPPLISKGYTVIKCAPFF